MGEDDKKRIAELYFGTAEAENGLTKIEEQLIRINKLTENYAKNAKINYGKNFANNFKVNTGTFDIEKLGKGAQKAYFEMQKEAEKTIRKNIQVQKSATTIYDKIADYAKTYLIYQGFNELRQSAQELVKEMVNVEYQMVQIDRVLNDSSLNINTYRDNLIQLAYDYGNSFENVADITLRLAQAGFDAQESLALTEKTLLALNTAELNATQATDDMVAIMAQWGLMTGTATEQAESYSKIIDKINITADNFPTTSADIMEAMKKTSSAFKLAGMDIDETIAIIVSAEKASQRGGKAIGTALSNISQQLKTTARIDVAKDLGIDFFKDENKTEYKDLIDILGELSEKMQQLKDDGKESSAEMQKLLEVFTVFRRNIGASLLGEMSGENSTYQQVMDILGDPETIGYSMRENAKHMDTAKAALAQFEAELLKLKTAVWDGGAEDVFRGLLMLGTDLAKVLTVLVDTFGTVPVTVAVVTLAFTTLKKNLQATNLEIDITNKKITGISSNSKLMTKAVSKLNAAMEAGKISTNGLKVATIALNAAYSIGLSLAISAVISLFQHLITAEEKAAEAAKENYNKIKEETNAIKEQKESIENLINEYEELNKTGINNPENTEQVAELQIKLNKILKEEGIIIDETNVSLKEKIKLLDEAYDKNLRNELASKRTELEAQKEASKIRFGIFDRSYGLVDYSKINKSQDINDMSFEEQKETIEEYIEYLENYEKVHGQTYGNLEQDLKGAKEIYQELIQTEKGFIETQNDVNELLVENASRSLIDNINSAKDYENALEKINNMELLPDFSGSLEEQQQYFEYFLSKAFPEYNAQLEVAKGNISAYNILIDSELSKIELLENKYSTLTSAVDQYNRSGGITVETFKSLIDNNLLQYLDLVDGKLKINEALMIDNANAAKENAVAYIQEQLAAEILAIATEGVSKELNDQQTASDNSVVASNNASEAAKKMAASFSGAYISISAVNAALKKQDIDVAGLSAEQTSAINKAIDNANKRLSLIDSLSLKAAKSSSGASRGATKTFEEQSQERIKIFKQEIDEYESLEKSWVNKYKKLELFGTSDLKFITHQRINRYNDYLNQIRNLTGISEEDRTDLLREYTSKRQELELEYFDLLKQQLEEQIDALEKANDEKIKLIEEEADAQIEALRKVEDENDRIREKEEYERKRNELLYGYQGIEYWRQRSGAEAQRALLEAEQELAELDKDWEEKKEGWTLEDQIEEIENARDAQIKAIEEAQEIQIQAWKDAYQAQVNLYAETGQIIYDNSVINAGYLYDAYMSNFVNPLNVKLREINSAISSATTAAENASSKIDSAIKKAYSADFIGPLPIEVTGMPTFEDLKKRLTNIGKFHGGGLVNTAAEEALAIVRKNEVVLRPEWAAGLDKLVQQINSGGSLNNTSNNTNVNVYGNLANFDAIKVNERKDVANIEKLITQILKDKFNINK